MKKLFAFLAVIGMLSIGTNTVFAQENENVAEEATQTEQVVEETPAVETTAAAVEEEAAEAPKGIHKELKTKFIEGNAFFMSFVLMALIFGLALCIERIIYLNMASTNTKKLLQNIENALNDGGVEAAKEVCRNTRGPVASIFYQGLDRFDEGIEVVEKSVISYGSVQMGLLEKGLTWISLFIALAPMLGFMGTVIGMIDAFDSIQTMGTISATAVAGGIKLALITTVSGLIVAIILQVFYNYIVSKIDGIVNSMEDASISLLDILVKYNMKKIVVNMTKLTKILNIVLYVLLAITLVFAGMFYFGGEEVGAALPTPIYTDSYLNWGKLLVVVAVGVTVIFEVLHLIFNARNAVRTFISIGVLLVVALIGYGLSDSTPMEIIGYSGSHNVPSILSMAGTILYGTYILLGGVVVTILYTELSRMFK